jgi:hypothetical protein
MRTTGEAVRFSPETGTIRTTGLSEETAGADVAQAATWTPAMAEPINVAAIIMLATVLLMIFSSGLRGWALPFFLLTSVYGQGPLSFRDQLPLGV